MERVIRLDLGGVNSYLIESEGNFILVDTGGHMFTDKFYNDRLEALTDKLMENGVTKDNLKLLVLTHGDNDHANNVAYIKREYSALVAIGEADSYMIQNPKWDCYKVNLKFSSKLIGLAIRIMRRKIEGLMKKIYKEFTCIDPDILLKDGMNLREYGFDVTIYSTPGHTPGSISILDKQGNLICGDIFENNKKPGLAMNAADFKITKKEAGRILALPVKKIFPGHGEPFSTGDLQIAALK